MTSDVLGPYRVSAYNTAHDSDNKIHDGAFARSLGFGGGMVPGVAVYGYMTHLPVMRWGRAWLERGTAECRFYKPVYDGDIATVTATMSDGILDISVESRGEVCATGRAAMPDGPAVVPSLDLFPRVPQRAERPPADEASLATETWLGLDPYPITAEASARYLADLREAAPIYAEEGLIHPALILQSCNLVLNRNVVIGPWVHTGSRVQHLATAAVGDSLSVRARITDNYQRKGHRLVVIDALVLAGERTPIARVEHTAIYRLRQAAAA
jgi:acyl dehydratase